MTVEEILTLFEYNYWANRRVLGAARSVPREDFVASVNPSRRSLRETLVHTLAVEWMWRMRCQKGSSPPRYVPADRFLEIESVRVAWVEEEKAMRSYLEGLTEGRLSETLRYTTHRGTACENVLWQALVHLVNHGTQHRAEAGLRLTELGHGPGDLDLVLYLQER